MLLKGLLLLKNEKWHLNTIKPEVTNHPPHLQNVDTLHLKRSSWNPPTWRHYQKIPYFVTKVKLSPFGKSVKELEILS
jgi:hypothetical protein